MEWTGKYEAEKLQIPTVSLHVHERIDTSTILDKVMKKETGRQETFESYFETEENNPIEEKAIQFYQHKNGWSNRLIGGDSLLVMNSLLRKERMADTVQMIYIDPPYGIKYGSNFQPFVSKKEVKDGSDKDLAYTPETIHAFKDTWDLEIHSYISYLRDRLVLSRELLKVSGSIGVQISDENMHYVRMLMDEVFGKKNFVGIIQYRTTATSITKSSIPIVCDYIIWYAKNKSELKYNPIYEKRSFPINDPNYRFVEINGERRRMSPEERRNPNLLPEGSKIYRIVALVSQGGQSNQYTYVFNNKKYKPPANRSWSIKEDGIKNLEKKNRLVVSGNTINRVSYFHETNYEQLNNMWLDTTSGGFEGKTYVVQTTAKTIRRFMLMTTDPGDLVFDPTCGSGTTAYVSEEYGRRWITVDTQRVAITLAKRRIMASKYKYYKLRYPGRGVDSGFLHSTPDGIFQKISASSLAYDVEPESIVLHGNPDEDKNKMRVSGPFTVEAVPSPMAISIDALYDKRTRGTHIATINKRQEEWRAKLHASGIRGRNGEKIEFIEVSSFPTTRYIHARGITNETAHRNVMISFGPEHYPFETRQVTGVFEEVKKMKKKPDVVVFGGMQFDPEAANNIDNLELNGVTFLKAQMNADNFVGHLKKNKSGGDDFMIVGQPEIKIDEGNGMYTVSVLGFDFYDIANDKIVSGDISHVVMWMLDTDYDGRSVYPQQVFFPMGGKDTWSNLYKTLNDYIEPDYLETYKGSKSIPFKPGKKNRVAVKIVDDRGIESMCVMEVKSGKN
ncbi:adenine specific DNA methylase [Cenarchaeum symbiosum A]|uniref:Adenine specific DNA methylase n=1 Tax=Cenarchaeum symbiosum (strain A) TaxID=414004 RepID=A0RVB8_CENSY|nr:adenine specific DNA methylase [Cenarchaeum symbiosum A]